MCEKFTPADIDDYHELFYCQYRELMEMELDDRNLTKQGAIVRALERLVGEISGTADIIDEMHGEKREEKPEWRVSEMPLCEFLFELPAILNSLTLDMYDLQVHLNRAVFLRRKPETAVRPPEVDKPHDGDL